jgi:preprotein translocase subunit SecA
MTPEGGILFSFAIERLLDSLAEQVPALGEMWQAHAAAVETLQAARNALVDPAAAQPAAPALEILQQHAKNIMEHAPAVRTGVLAMARSAAERTEARYLELVSDRVARWAEQLPARAKSRGELAELAYDGALEDARENGRPLQVRVVAKAMFDNAGLGQLLPRAELQHVTPENLRVEIARQVEQLAGAEQLQTALRGLQVQYKLPAITAVPAWDELDWNALQDALEESARTAQAANNAQLLRELAQLLELRITRAEHLTRAELGRIIVDVSFNREATAPGARAQPGRAVQRFAYTGYVAAGLEHVHDTDGMQAELMAHLMRAFDARTHALGEAELQRLSSTKVAELEPALTAAMNDALQADGQVLDASASFSELAASARSAAQIVLGRRVATESMRQLMLSVSSQLWVDFLTSIESLRTSIGLEAYAQRDPLMAYKSRAFDEFKQLLNDMRSTVVSRMFTWQVRPAAPATAAAGAPAPGAAPKGASAAAIGRNDPCRCGSGKKYKNCCMKIDGA